MASVCLCLSQVGTLSKEINGLSWFLAEATIGLSYNVLQENMSIGYLQK